MNHRVVNHLRIIFQTGDIAIQIFHKVTSQFRVQIKYNMIKYLVISDVKKGSQITNMVKNRQKYLLKLEIIYKSR